MPEKKYLENGGEILAVVRTRQASSVLKRTSQVPEDIEIPNVRVKCHTQP